VRLALKVVMQNDGEFVDVILMNMVRNLDSTPTDQHYGLRSFSRLVGECCCSQICPCLRHEGI
jgi:hypothetical protein